MSRRGGLFSSIRRRFGKREVSQSDKEDGASPSNPTLTLTTPKDETVPGGGAASRGEARSGAIPGGNTTRISVEQTVGKLEVPNSVFRKPWPRQRHGINPQPNSASSLTEGVFEAMPGRQRTSSDVSASSYYTCTSMTGSKRASPTISRPETPGVPESYHHDSLSQVTQSVMQQIEWRMAKLEGKIDDMRNSLESRVSELEKRLEIKYHSSSPNFSSVELQPKGLSVVKEASHSFLYSYGYSRIRPLVCKP